MKRKLIIWGSAVLAILLATAILFFALIWNGVILLNNPSMERYPVRGVDVSSYQGEIDWDTLASQNISFAFIKATEGSSYVDPYFAENYQQAQQTGLRIGAYHFFSYDSSGETQADHFIATVSPVETMLPPVIDLEFYGDKEANPPSPETVRPQLDILLERLEEHYGRKPILYATEKSYALYLAGAYSKCRHQPIPFRWQRLDLLAVHQPGQTGRLPGRRTLHRPQCVPRHPGGIPNLSQPAVTALPHRTLSNTTAKTVFVFISFRRDFPGFFICKFCFPVDCPKQQPFSAAPSTPTQRAQ